jgi:predicted enzyme related to lactoylglutathione lyase
VVNHFGFVFRNLPAMIERWKAAGLTVEQAGNPNQGYVHAPDGVRVEFFGDPSLPVPMQIDHVHAYLPAKDIPAIQAWYAKVFGAEPGQRVRVATPGWTDAVFLPGLNWSFTSTEMPLAPTKGRSLDHMGFDVLDLDAFITHLASLGLAVDAPPRAIPGAKTRVAFLTDPWGTYLEITEHLAP